MHVKTAGAMHDGKTGDTAFIQKILERAATRVWAREKKRTILFQGDSIL